MTPTEAIAVLRQATADGGLAPSLLCSDRGRDAILCVLAECERLRGELSMWKPMTPEEAQKAYDEAEAVPMSKEEIDRIVEKVLDPAERLPNSEQAQLAVALSDERLRRKLCAARLAKAEAVCRAAEEYDAATEAYFDGLEQSAGESTDDYYLRITTAQKRRDAADAALAAALAEWKAVASGSAAGTMSG